MLISQATAKWLRSRLWKWNFRKGIQAQETSQKHQPGQVCKTLVIRSTVIKIPPKSSVAELQFHNSKVLAIKNQAQMTFSERSPRNCKKSRSQRQLTSNSMAYKNLAKRRSTRFKGVVLGAEVIVSHHYCHLNNQSQLGAWLAHKAWQISKQRLLEAQLTIDFSLISI